MDITTVADDLIVLHDGAEVTRLTGLQPSTQMCGSDRTQALQWLTWLERATAP